jgi:two-component system nitrate/nitrite response regulator NarL
MDTPAQVIVADDHPLIRAGVAAALHGKDFCEVVGEAKNAEAALLLVANWQPELLILDLDLGVGPRSSELILEARRRRPCLKVLVLSSHTDNRYLEPLQDCEIQGFVLKSEAPDSLVQAVRLVLSGERWFSHAVSAMLNRPIRQGATQPDSLTPRESQILRLVQEGRDNQSIATLLGLSKHSVRRYATNIYQKLNVKNRIEAILATGTPAPPDSLPASAF